MGFLMDTHLNEVIQSHQPKPSQPSQANPTLYSLTDPPAQTSGIKFELLQKWIEQQK